MKRLAALAVAALCTAACDPEYGSLRMKEGAGEIEYAYISNAGIVIEEGKVLVIFAEPVSTGRDNAYEGFEEFELEAVDGRIAAIHRGVLRDSFFIVGAAPGMTRMEVRIDGRVEETLPLEVIAQGDEQ
ncbi:MAG: hypothetical protein JKY37_19960 [Nannocystaceae bacterium]|nr:hypothetical protein [Nannocystaceae bacterium]